VKRAIHWSHLSSLAKCGHSFFLSYIEGLRVRPGIAIATGSAVHEVAAKNLTAKSLGEGLLPLEQIRDEARDAFARQWESGVTLLPEEIERGAVQLHGEAIDRTIRLSEAHATRLAPTMRPKVGGVERAWRLEVDGFPFDLEGEADLIEARDADGPSRVRDLKTSGKMPQPRVAGVSGQLTLYALAVQSLDGELPDEVGLDYCAASKDGSPTVQTFLSTRRPEHVEALWARIENAAAVIEKEAFTPADPLTSFLCAPAYCGFARTNPETGRPYCRYYADAPVTVALGSNRNEGGSFNGNRKQSRTIADKAARDAILAAL
jgi:hypothetical protein